MTGSKSLSMAAFRTASYRKPASGRRTSLTAAAAAAALLLWTGAAQADSCADLYRAIRAEAMHCGFFCNQARLKPLQEVYKASCIHVVLQLSPFDLDSIPQDAALVADVGGIDAEAPLSARAR